MSLTIKRTMSIHSLSIVAIEAYLNEKGWKKIEQSNKNAIVYEAPNTNSEEPIIAVLPTNRDQIDADNRLNDVIRLIAVLEAKSRFQIVREILADKTRRRVSSQKSLVHPRNGKSPYSNGSNIHLAKRSQKV